MFVGKFAGRIRTEAKQRKAAAVINRRFLKVA